MDIKVFRKNLSAALVFLPDQLANNAGDAMEQSKGKFETQFQRERLNFTSIQPAGGGLRRVTGSLSRSFTHLVRRGSLVNLRTTHQSAGVPYAAAHEFGTKHLPPRLGFYNFWEAHIESDLMPRLERATAKTVRDA